MLCRESYADFPAIFTDFTAILHDHIYRADIKDYSRSGREVPGMAELSDRAVQDYGSIPRGLF